MMKRLWLLGLILCCLATSANAFWVGGGSGGSGGAGIPGGANTQIQFNDDGVFGATATAKINKTTGKTTFTKEVNIGVVEGAGYTGALQNNGGGSWSKNAFVTIVASTDALPTGYTHRLILSTTTSLLSSTVFTSCLPIGNDLRLEYFNGTAWVERDRRLVTFTNGLIEIDFALASSIAANTGSGQTYRIVYGNPLSGAEASNRDNIYLFWDDFQTGTLGKWAISAGATIIDDGDGNFVARIASGHISSTVNLSQNIKTEIEYKWIEPVSDASLFIYHKIDDANYIKGSWWDPSWEPTILFIIYTSVAGVTDVKPYPHGPRYPKSSKSRNVWYSAALSRSETTYSFYDQDSTTIRETREVPTGSLAANVAVIKVAVEQLMFINNVYTRRYVNSDSNIVVVAETEQSSGMGVGLLTINASDGVTSAITINQSGNANAITTTSPVTIGKTKITGAIDLPYKSITAAYTVTTSDYFIECNSTSAIFTVALPTAVGCAGREYVFVKNNAANDITIDPFNVETINGAATYILSAQWSKVTIVSNGTNWIIKI